MAQGGRGAPKPADDEYASQHLPGMRANLTPDQEKRGNKRDRSNSPPKGSPKQEKKKRQRARLKERLAAAQAQLGGQQAFINTGGPKGGPKGKGRGRGAGRGAGGGGGGGGAVDPNSSCFSFSKGFGPCAGMPAGSPCKGGRSHKCHICGGTHPAAECPKKPKKEGN